MVLVLRSWQIQKQTAYTQNFQTYLSAVYCFKFKGFFLHYISKNRKEKLEFIVTVTPSYFYFVIKNASVLQGYYLLLFKAT